MSTIDTFDPKRYSGRWYEIAKYKFKWQLDCADSVAIYVWDTQNQKLLVENQCYDKNGIHIRSRFGEAIIPNPNDPGKLILNFTDGLPKDPKGDYWIHWTDYDNYSIVGGPSKQFLWLLSRKDKIKASEVEPLLKKIRSYGYDTEKLMANPKNIVP
jgi:lipocalin